MKKVQFGTTSSSSSWRHWPRCLKIQTQPSWLTLSDCTLWSSCSWGRNKYQNGTFRFLFGAIGKKVVSSRFLCNFFRTILYESGGVYSKCNHKHWMSNTVVMSLAKLDPVWKKMRLSSNLYIFVHLLRANRMVNDSAIYDRYKRTWNPRSYSFLRALSLFTRILYHGGATST